MRETTEGERCIEMGIERRLRVKRSAPQLEVLIFCAESNVMKAAAMIMHIGESGQGEQAASAGTRHTA